jgi:hypothetical protein
MVRVKLTDYGKDIFYHKNDELNQKIVNHGGKPLEPYFPRVDEFGFSEFQIWHFMNIYGKYFQMGFKDVLQDLSFYIDEKDLDEV